MLMKTRTLKELLLYNYRYWIGYSIVIGFIVYFLGWRLGSLVPGLSAREISTAAANTSLLEILKLPIYPLHSFLQWASIELFGVSPFILRAPSVVIALLTAFFLYQLLKKWFGKPTALLSTAIFVSADWFLFIARSGTGAIEFSFWLCLALLSFTKLLERKNKWVLLYAISLAGLILCPFGIYAVITLLVSLFMSRVFRERAKEASIWLKIPSVLIVVGTFIATIGLSIGNIALARSLVGIETIPTISEFIRNLFFNASAIIAVFPTASQTVSPTGILFFRFFELIFVGFGVIMLWRTRVNRLNLTVLILSVVLVIAGGLSPVSLGGSLLFIPAAIFMTAGIRHFIYRWQKTFPKNPYARTAALIPLAFLFITAVGLHYISYFNLWPNQTGTAVAFTRDFGLAQSELQNDGYTEKLCFVDSSDKNFNVLLQSAKINCELAFANGDVSTELPAVTLLKPESKASLGVTGQQVRALVSETTLNNVRWLVVTPAAQ